MPAGVALYWIASNIFAIVQLYLLNWAINPKKYVDYEDLEESKKELAALEGIGGNSGKKKLFEKIHMQRGRKLIIRDFSQLLISILYSILRIMDFTNYYAGMN